MQIAGAGVATMLRSVGRSVAFGQSGAWAAVNCAYKPCAEAEVGKHLDMAVVRCSLGSPPAIVFGGYTRRLCLLCEGKKKNQKQKQQEQQQEQTQQQ